MSRAKTVDNFYSEIIWNYLKIFKNEDDPIIVTRKELESFIMEILIDYYLRKRLTKELQVKKHLKENYEKTLHQRNTRHQNSPP